jgi:hypothetical protein
MDDDYITPDRKHSSLLIIDVQSDFTLAGASMEIPGTSQSVPYNAKPARPRSAAVTQGEKFCSEKTGIVKLPGGARMTLELW